MEYDWSDFYKQVEIFECPEDGCTYIASAVNQDYLYKMMDKHLKEAHGLETP